MTTLNSPEFEQALQDCASEPIHRLGKIQPHGAVVVFNAELPPVVVQASANLGQFCAVVPEWVLGQPLQALFDEAGCAEVMRLIDLARQQHVATGRLPASLLPTMQELVVHVYATEGLFALELEHGEGFQDQRRLADLLLHMHQSMLGTESIQDIVGYLEQITHLVQELTGFDSVMAYRFDAHWNGEVIAQSRVATAPSYLGLHFPASDIPAQARRLYTTNLVRVIADIDAAPVALNPALNPYTGQFLDMTYAALRYPSDIHIEYLSNIGVKASLVISLLQNGRLWGLVACHHWRPRQVSLLLRDAAIFISRMVTSRLSVIEALEQRQLSDRAIHIHAQLLKALPDEHVDRILKQLLPELQSLLNATGVMVLVEGRRYGRGTLPTPEDISALLDWLSRSPDPGIFSTDALGLVFAPARAYPEMVSGLLTTPTTRQMTNGILWFRKEKPRMVQWAGHYDEGFVRNSAGNYRLTPRKSFEIWSESWQGRSAPWTQLEVDVVAMLALTLPDALSQKSILNAALDDLQSTMRSLRSSEERLSLVFEATREAVWDYDVGTGLVRHNQRWSELLGLDGTALEHPMAYYFDRIHPADRERMLERFALTTQHGMDYEGEYRLCHRDGDYFWVEDHGKIVTRDADGQPLRIVGAFALITERKQVEQALRNSESKFRQALHFAAIGMALVQLDGRWLEVNPALCRIVGYSQDILLDRDIQSMTHPGDRDAIQNLIHRTLNGDLDAFQLEMRYLHRDGHPVWVQINASLVRHNDSGMPHYFIFQIQDITGRRALLEHLQTLLDSASDGVHILDTQGQLIEYSQSFARMLGYAPEEMAGMNVTDWDAQLPPDDLLERLQALQHESATFETRHRRKDGTVFDAEVNAHGIVLGGCARIYGSSRNISLRKSVETALRETKDRLEAAASAGIIGIWEWDVVHDLLWWDPVMYQLYGVSPNGSNGCYDTWSSALHPEDRVHAQAAIHAALRGERDYLTEFRVLWPDGSVHFIKAVARTECDAQGQPLRMLGVNYDVTEQKQTEQALAEARNQAEAANRAKSTFLATMSHELRTPLNGILGMAQLLRAEEVKDRERHDFARTILNAGQTLLALLNDILDLSKIEAGKLKLEVAELDLTQMLLEIKNLFMQSASAKHLALTIQWSGPRRQCYATDGHRLRQMLANLLSNAIKFTSAGSVTLDVREIERDATTALLEFAVTDTGCGIPEDKKSLLFKPFSQADSSISRQFGGTGLGLAIVRNLARAMDGDTGVDSVAGQGSRFWFRIRVALSTAMLDAQEPQHERASERLAPLRGQVLVIEDDPNNQQVIGYFLKYLGLEHLLVGQGQLGVEALMAGNQAEAILMDLHLPGLDGFATTALIRQWERDNGGSRHPIIALTADVAPDTRQHCLDAGMDAYLSKPLMLEELHAALSCWLPPAAAAEQSGAFDLPRILSVLEALRPLLVHQQFAAFGCCASLQELTQGTVLAEDVAAMASALEQMQFDLAATRLSRLRTQLNGPSTD